MLRQLLKGMVEQDATDLHLVEGSPPCMRVASRIHRIKSESLKKEQIKEMAFSILSEAQKARFEKEKELDFAVALKGVARFRGNLSYQQGGVSVVFRKIPNETPSMKSLNLPPIVSSFTKHVSGLVLVTGATGSGKSTTLAAMIDQINEEESGTIITIEDPIEYVHKHKNCIIKQREIGVDTTSYPQAIKHLLRQDPDYCLIGELRDLDSIETALLVAETGHLVFASLHTNSAIDTISRIIQVFPADQQDRIRMQLSHVLQGIVCQQLLPSSNQGLKLALEVLVPTPGIRNLIREDKLHQIKSLMQMGQNQTGMVTLNQSLMSLLMKRHINMKTAFASSADPDELDRMLRKAGF